MGEGEQVFQFRAPPGAELVSNIVATIEKNLTATSQIPPDQTVREEAKLFDREVEAAAKGKTLLPPSRYSTNDYGQYLGQLMEKTKQERLKEAQRALLLDTNNLKAKSIVAFYYYSETNDPALQERGRQMYEELSTCTNATTAYQAYYVLAHGISVLGANNRMTLAVKPVRAVDPDLESKHERQIRQSVLKTTESSFASNTNDIGAKFRLAETYFTDLDDVTNRVHGMQMFEEFLTNETPFYAEFASNIFANNIEAKYWLAEAYFTNLDDVTKRERGWQMLEEFLKSGNSFYAESAGKILANGVNVSNGKSGSIRKMPAKAPEATNNPNSKAKEKSAPSELIPERPPFTVVDSFSEWPFCVVQDNGWLISKGAKLSFYDMHGGKMDVACPTRRNITALAADKDFWWIGTEGDGLIRISKSGNPPKFWTETNGLLMPAISALYRNGDRLWTGFNFRGSGGLGYLDVKTEKFIGLHRDINFSAQGAGATTPGDAPVVSIQTANEKSFWLYSGNELQQCDSASGQPTRTIAGLAHRYVAPTRSCESNSTPRLSCHRCCLGETLRGEDWAVFHRLHRRELHFTQERTPLLASHVETHKWCLRLPSRWPWWQRRLSFRFLSGS
jgi:hypothetical protein